MRLSFRSKLWLLRVQRVHQVFGPKLDTFCSEVAVFTQTDPHPNFKGYKFVKGLLISKHTSFFRARPSFRCKLLLFQVHQVFEPKLDTFCGEVEVGAKPDPHPNFKGYKFEKGLLPEKHTSLFRARPSFRSKLQLLQVHWVHQVFGPKLGTFCSGDIASAYIDPQPNFKGYKFAKGLLP